MAPLLPLSILAMPVTGTHVRRVRGPPDGFKEPAAATRIGGRSGTVADLPVAPAPDPGPAGKRDGAGDPGPAPLLDRSRHPAALTDRHRNPLGLEQHGLPRDLLADRLGHLSDAEEPVRDRVRCHSG